MMVVYAVVLFKASNMLSEGSELLLLVPSLAGIVGSVVLPILGAVPDGAIMLFSGLGPDAQEQLSVGVGALAGSTIMLLTVPWGGAIMAGRVGIGADGCAHYVKRKKGVEVHDQKAARGLRGTWSNALFNTGVTPDKTIKANAFLVMGTSLIYLLIQGPAFSHLLKSDTTSDKEMHTIERWWALAGLLVAVGSFVGYLVVMVRQSSQAHIKEKKEKQMLQAIQVPAPLTPHRTSHIASASSIDTTSHIASASSIDTTSHIASACSIYTTPHIASACSIDTTPHIASDDLVCLLST